jgi:predicted methyltransferase
LKLPEIVDAASVMVAQASLLNEVARGNLTPEEAESLSAMLSAYLKTVETVDIDRRLRDIENKMTDRK